MSESVMLSQSKTWQSTMVASGDSRGVRGRPQLSDYLFFVVLAVGAVYALNAYSEYMDVYEKGILLATVPMLTWMGWLWRPLRTMMILSGLSAVFAIWLYSVDGNLLNGDINKAEQVFLLRDRKSTRLNSSHVKISYAVFC